MTTFLLVLLGIVVVSMVLFAALLFRLSLEDADFWLKVLSATLAIFVVGVGLAALITGHLVNQKLTERVALIDKARAEAELQLAKLRKGQAPRIALIPEIVSALKDKPAGMATIT